MTITKTLFSKTAAIPAIALAAMVPFAGIAHADEAAGDIIVTSQAEMAAWQKGAMVSLNRSLAHSSDVRSAAISDGIVQIAFEMGADGEPTNLEVVSSDANWVAERVAKRAVRRLGDISDVPVANAKDARFLANIVFADNVKEHAELMSEVKKSMGKALASGESGYIVIGG